MSPPSTGRRRHAAAVVTALAALPAGLVVLPLAAPASAAEPQISIRPTLSDNTAVRVDQSVDVAGTVPDGALTGPGSSARWPTARPAPRPWRPR